MLHVSRFPFRAPVTSYQARSSLPATMTAVGRFQIRSQFLAIRSRSALRPVITLAISWLVPNTLMSAGAARPS